MKRNRNHSKRPALARAMWDVIAARVALIHPRLAWWEYAQRLARLHWALDRLRRVRWADTRPPRPDGRLDPRRAVIVRINARGAAASEVRALLANLQNEIGGA